MTPERERLEVPTLEELLERGEVKSALLLKGDFTERERDLIRQAWEAGLATAADQLEQAEQREKGLREALEEINGYCEISGIDSLACRAAREALAAQSEGDSRA